MSAALSMRTVESVSASFSFMARTISAWMRSLMLASVMGSSNGLRSVRAALPSRTIARGRPALRAPPSLLADIVDRAASASAHRRHDVDLAVLGNGRGEAAGEADALHADEELNVLAHLAGLGEDAVAHRRHFPPQRVERVREIVERARQLHRGARAGKIAQDGRQPDDDGHRYLAREALRACRRADAFLATVFTFALSRESLARLTPRACGTRIFAGLPATTARTHSTGGMPSATSDHELPPSAEPYTLPLRVPK